MLKWIAGTVIIYGLVGYYLASSSYTPISKQIDVKTMSLKEPDYIIVKTNICNGTCENYTSSSSYGGGGSFGGK